VAFGVSYMQESASGPLWRRCHHCRRVKHHEDGYGAAYSLEPWNSRWKAIDLTIFLNSRARRTMRLTEVLEERFRRDSMRPVNRPCSVSFVLCRTAWRTLDTAKV